jgi:hypothetical protein
MTTNKRPDENEPQINADRGASEMLSFNSREKASRRPAAAGLSRASYKKRKTEI